MATNHKYEGISLPFSPESVPAPDLRITLESESGLDSDNSPTLADIEAMLAMAKSGLSARSYQLEQCQDASINADGTLTVNLSVLVWPSVPGLTYNLSLPNEARLGELAEVRQERRHRIWTGGNTVHELPWRMEGATFSWHSRLPLCNEKGVTVAAPRIALDHARIIIAAPVYGLLTVSGEAVGYRHEFSLDFAKLDETGAAKKIDLDSVPVTATWTNAAGEEESVEADVAIPPCAAALLETCEEGRGRPVFLYETKKSGRGYYEVAYSSCDGSVLGVRLVKGGEGEGND